MRPDLKDRIAAAVDCLPDQLDGVEIVTMVVAMAAAFADTKEEVVQFTEAAHLMARGFAEIDNETWH